MMQEYYQLLGVTEESTDEEIHEKYLALKAKYSEDRWLEGEAGNEAAKMLNRIETAYQEILAHRLDTSKGANGQTAFDEVEKLISEGKLKEAQDKLDEFNERGAHWHYLQAAVFYKKQWMNESKKQLEIAMQLDPTNEKYKKEYDRITQKDEETKAKNQAGQGGSYRYDASSTLNDDAEQMGGSGCSECLSWCTTCFCMNAIFNMCCGCR